MAGTLRSAASAAFPPDPVRVARPEHVLPEDHVADEHVFLLHCEEAAQVALGEIELAHAPASRGSIEAQRHRNLPSRRWTGRRRQSGIACHGTSGLLVLQEG